MGWDWLKNAATRALELGSEQLHNYQLIERLLALPGDEALEELQAQVEAMSEHEFKAFKFTLNMMISRARQQLDALESEGGYDDSWGGSSEDRIAQRMAYLQAGAAPPNQEAIAQVRQRYQALVDGAEYADYFRSQMPTASPPPSAASSNATPQGEQPAPPSEDQSMDDMDKLHAYMAADSRLLQAMPGIMPGAASEKVVEEFQSILASYRQLLAAGAPQTPLYTLDDIRVKIADTLEYIARTYVTMRDDDAAVPYLEEAAQAYDAVGKLERAVQCNDDLAQIRLSQGGDVDREIERLLQRLEGTAPASLPRIETLLDLGELYCKGGDDYEARRYLHEAEQSLVAMGYDNPPAEAVAEDLLSSMNRILSDEQEDGPTQIEITMRVRALYQRLYQALARAYREESLDKAAEYEQRGLAMQSQEGSAAFGQRMQGLLNGDYRDILKKLSEH